MEKQNKKLIIFIGRTHSGKTTFAKKLEKKYKNLLVLEADPIEIFLKEQFPRFKELNEKLNVQKDNILLRRDIFLLFLKFALKSGRPIVLSNANIWKEWRDQMIELGRQSNYKVIGIYFDIPDKVLLERVKKAKRPTKFIREAKNFKDLLASQKSRIQIPRSFDFDKFFVIKTENDLEKIKKELL